MSNSTYNYDEVSVPALLRHARMTYGMAMRKALEASGFEDIPKNGLYVIGGLALNVDEDGGSVPLTLLIRDLRISKQAAGQLVDTLVSRGYLERTVDETDRRRLTIALTERGRMAAEVQTQARKTIDAALLERLGERGMQVVRKGLAALIEIGRQQEAEQAGANDR